MFNIIDILTNNYILKHKLIWATFNKQLNSKFQGIVILKENSLLGMFQYLSNLIFVPMSNLKINRNTILISEVE